MQLYVIIRSTFLSTCNYIHVSGSISGFCQSPTQNGTSMLDPQNLRTCCWVAKLLIMVSWKSTHSWYITNPYGSCFISLLFHKQYIKGNVTKVCV